MLTSSLRAALPHDRPALIVRTTRSPAAYSWMRHRLALIGAVQGGEHDGHDGRGRWPGGARPSRWRRWASAGAAPADVGQAQAERGVAAAAGRGSGAGVAGAGGDGGRAERLARRLPGGGRGVAEDPASRWP